MVKNLKDNFPHSISCGLINPSKTDTRKISKAILNKINIQIVSSTKVNQWKNSDSIINWFTNIPEKKLYTLLFLILKISTVQSPWNSSTKHCRSQKVYVKSPMNRLLLLCKPKHYFLTIANHGLKSLGIKISMFLWAVLMQRKFLKLLELTF